VQTLYTVYSAKTTFFDLIPHDPGRRPVPALAIVL